MKVFISGGISGIKYETARRKCEVVNPLVLCDKDWSWLHCMLVCLCNLAKCDIVYFMSNHRESKGSKIELFFAKLLGKTIIKA